MAPLVLMTEEQKKQLAQAWIYTCSRMKDYFDALTVVMRDWFPVVSGAHRESVRIVRTQYRRKQKARKRRHRRR